MLKLYKTLMNLVLFRKKDDNNSKVVYMESRKRPHCSRCKGPLDLWCESDIGYTTLICNNPDPLSTDKEFWKRWGNLPGDDVARLER